MTDVLAGHTIEQVGRGVPVLEHLHKHFPRTPLLIVQFVKRRHLAVHSSSNVE